MWSPKKCISYGDPEEERQVLLGSIRTLANQLAAEKSRREAAETESRSTAEDKRGLETRLQSLAACRDRQSELQKETELNGKKGGKLDFIFCPDLIRRRKPVQLLHPDAVLFNTDDKPEVDGDESEEEDKRENAAADDDHAQMCVRRAEVVKRRGVLLLNEVDAQYGALQLKYDALLQRCQQANGGLSHKSVQTPRGPRDPALVPDQPEYKILFEEIFTCIRKTKEDLHDNKFVRGASAL
ncbi:cerebellar degeneration-related protein 2-like [Stigmatopora argus]